MFHNVFTEKRKRGWVLIQMTAVSKSSSAREIWKPSLLAPRKPRYFKTSQEATDWAKQL